MGLRRPALSSLVRSTLLHMVRMSRGRPLTVTDPRMHRGFPILQSGKKPIRCGGQLARDEMKESLTGLRGEREGVACGIDSLLRWGSAGRGSIMANDGIQAKAVCTYIAPYITMSSFFAKTSLRFRHRLSEALRSYTWSEFSGVCRSREGNLCC